MKRIHVVLAAMLMVAACGGSDSGTTTTGGGDGGTSATTEATTTTTAPATTTVASTDPVDARLAIAQAFASDYEGEWVNTTFGSTGAIRISNVQVHDFGSMTLTLDVDGNAFGGPDPNEQLIEIDFNPDPPQVLGSLLGGASIEFRDDGSWVVEGSPPGLDGGTIRVEMTLTTTGFEGTYEVSQPDGTVFAEGTFSATRTG